MCRPQSFSFPMNKGKTTCSSPLHTHAQPLPAWQGARRSLWYPPSDGQPPGATQWPFPPAHLQSSQTPGALGSSTPSALPALLAGKWFRSRQLLVVLDVMHGPPVSSLPPPSRGQGKGEAPTQYEVHSENPILPLEISRDKGQLGSIC